VTRIVALLTCLALVAACGDAKEEGPPFELEPPEHTVYDDDAEPTAPVPADVEDPAGLDWPPAQVGTDTGDDGILYAAVLGGYYILRVQNADGSYRINYEADRNEWSNEGYLIHRMCGTTYTQAWLYRVTRREEFRHSTELGLRFIRSEATELEDGTLKVADVGGTSIFALALTEHARITGTTDWDETIDKVGQYILTHLRDDPDTENGIGAVLRRGQSLQALWHLYDYTRDERYLDELETRAREIHDNPVLHDDSFYFALWANEPLGELNRVRPADWIPPFVFHFSDIVVDLQYGPETSTDPKAYGGYVSKIGNKPKWNTTLRLEAVIDGYRLAVQAGDEERIERYGKSALEATHFLLGLQIRAEDLEDYDEEERELILGALPWEYGRNTLRVDITHHFVNVLIKVVEYMELEDYPGKEE
jgi:hypothetical protein